MIDNDNTALADLLENGEPAIYYEANSANIRRFLDRGPYNIEWLIRKYLGVGFKELQNRADTRNGICDQIPL